MQKTNITTSYREDLHERIPMAAIRLFQQKGVKAVRMDDIANHLQISKRTLYEIYDNKEDLLLEGIKRTEEIYNPVAGGYTLRHSVWSVPSVSARSGRCP